MALSGPRQKEKKRKTRKVKREVEKQSDIEDSRDLFSSLQRPVLSKRTMPQPGHEEVDFDDKKKRGKPQLLTSHLLSQELMNHASFTWTQ